MEVNQRHRKDIYDLKLDEPLTIHFDYITNQERKKATHRVGNATLTFRRLSIFHERLPGKLECRCVYKKGKKVLVDDVKYIENVSSDCEEKDIVDLEDGYSYGLSFLDLDNRRAIIYSFESQKPEDGSESPIIYYSFDLDKEFRRVDSSEEKLHKRQDVIITIRYIKDK